VDEDDHDIAVVDVEVFDLALRKRLAAGQSGIVRVGDDVTFTIEIFNQGNVTATNIVVVDYVPLGFELSSSDANGWVLMGPQVVSNVIPGPLAPTEVTTIEIVLRVLTATGRITNTAEISSAEDELGNPRDDIDSTPDDTDGNDNLIDDEIDDDGTVDEDDHDIAVVDVEATPELEIVKRVSVPTGVSSATVRYTIDITNTGQIPIYPVYLSDTLETGLTFIPGTFTPISPTFTADIPAGQFMYWDNVVTQPLQPGQNTQVSFEVRISTRITGTYRNIVTVTGEHPGGVVTDTDEVPLEVRDPSVEVNKEVASPGRAVNGVITFTIRITNTGPSTLTVVPLFDFFTGPVVYIGGTPPADLVDNVSGLLAWNDLTLSFGDMVPGQSFTVTTVFSITEPGESFTMTNTAVVTDATDEYDNEANDDDDDETVSGPTAVELLYFDAVLQTKAILLRWATAIEIDNFGFRLRRSTTGNLVDALEIAFIPGQGQGTTNGATYEYTDRDVERGETYTYWLVDVEFSGLETYHGPRLIHFDPFYNVYLPLVLKE
jgi:uncharacterized repeat protein (TIGR01451 family)